MTEMYKRKRHQFTFILNEPMSNYKDYKTVT